MYAASCMRMCAEKTIFCACHFSNETDPNYASFYFGRIWAKQWCNWSQNTLKIMLRCALNFLINVKPTQVYTNFKFCKKVDFLPLLNFPGCDPLEVIGNLSWTARVNDINVRATKKLWVLVRFKASKLPCIQQGCAPLLNLLPQFSTQVLLRSNQIEQRGSKRKLLQLFLVEITIDF